MNRLMAKFHISSLKSKHLHLGAMYFFRICFIYSNVIRAYLIFILITYLLMKSFAIFESVKDFHLAVGIPCLSIKAFAQSLLDSICAAFFCGPNVFIPARVRASAKPLARGSSGPTTTKEIPLSLQKLIISCETPVS